MAGKEKKSKGEKKEKKSSGGRMSGMMLLIVGLGLAFVIQSTFILLLMGMLPSFAAYYVDTAKRKILFHTVCSCNLAGVMPYVAELMAKGNNGEMFMNYAADPSVWFYMYFAAGIGWFLNKGGATTVQIFLEMTAQAKIARLEYIQRQLLDEWGPELMMEDESKAKMPVPVPKQA